MAAADFAWARMWSVCLCECAGMRSQSMVDFPACVDFVETRNSAQTTRVSLCSGILLLICFECFCI